LEISIVLTRHDVAEKLLYMICQGSVRMFSYLFCDKSVAVVTLNAKDHYTVRRDNPNTIKLVVFPSSTHFYGIMGICPFGATHMPTCILILQ
jgi:hypothetical protein